MLITALKLIFKSLCLKQRVPFKPSVTQYSLQQETQSGISMVSVPCIVYPGSFAVAGRVSSCRYEISIQWSVQVSL